MARSTTNSVDGSEQGERTPRRFDRYEMVVNAAAEIFRKNGYDATSLQQVADQVGILKGSLYHYIATKEDLLFAIIERNHQHIITQNAEWRELVEQPVVALRSFIEGHVRGALWNPVYSGVFVRDFRALSPERAKIIQDTQDVYAGEFQALVTAAIEGGHLREGVDPVFASRAVFGMTNWIPAWYRPGGATPDAEVIEKIADYAMASLMGPVG